MPECEVLHYIVFVSEQRAKFHTLKSCLRLTQDPKYLRKDFAAHGTTQISFLEYHWLSGAKSFRCMPNYEANPALHAWWKKTGEEMGVCFRAEEPCTDGGRIDGAGANHCDLLILEVLTCSHTLVGYSVRVPFSRSAVVSGSDIAARPLWCSWDGFRHYASLPHRRIPARMRYCRTLAVTSPRRVRTTFSLLFASSVH